MWSQYTIQDHFVVIQLLTHLHTANRNGDKTRPCRTPQLTLKSARTSKFYTTEHSNEPYHKSKIRVKARGSCLLISLVIRPDISTLSNALLAPKNAQYTTVKIRLIELGFRDGVRIRVSSEIFQSTRVDLMESIPSLLLNQCISSFCGVSRHSLVQVDRYYPLMKLLVHIGQLHFLGRTRNRSISAASFSIVLYPIQRVCI